MWDLQDSSVAYQSHVISSSPFLCGAVDMQSQHLATGTADGMVCVDPPALTDPLVIAVCCIRSVCLTCEEGEGMVV